MNPHEKNRVSKMMVASVAVQDKETSLCRSESFFGLWRLGVDI